jgi:hypothetical protein
MGGFLLLVDGVAASRAEAGWRSRLGASRANSLWMGWWSLTTKHDANTQAVVVSHRSWREWDLGWPDDIIRLQRCRGCARLLHSSSGSRSSQPPSQASDGYEHRKSQPVLDGAGQSTRLNLEPLSVIREGFRSTIRCSNPSKLLKSTVQVNNTPDSSRDLSWAVME